MFYDLEEPMKFMQDVHDVLEDDGVWVFEQSYMPTMLETVSYDTVCHEHLEFYALHPIKWMADRVGLKILDVEFNDINGGSFSITAAKSSSKDESLPASVQKILDQEKILDLDSLKPYEIFSDLVLKSKDDLWSFVEKAKQEGKSIVALGASTKGNVLLQYCGFSDKDISYVGEVNQEKFGCYTPGTWIPIIPEDELLAKKPDYLIVLPWHFKNYFINNPKFSGFDLVFPLPKLEVVTQKNT